jgi:multiple sugar transport system substrate-binding protein
MAHKMTRRTLMRTVAVGGLGLASMSAFGACAPKAEPTPVPPAEKVEEKAPAAPAPKEPVVLTLQMRAGGEEGEAPIYMERPAEFMEENPDIKVELAPIPGGEYWVKIQTMAAGGTLGDAMWTADVWTDHTRFVKLGIIDSVDEYLDVEGVSKDEWFPATVDTLTVEGKMYGFPKCSHSNFPWVQINEALFEDAGLAVPEEWGNKPAEFLEWAQKIAKGPKDDREVFSYYPQAGAITGIATGGRQFGVFENNDEGTESLYDLPEWYEWVKWVNTFYREGLAIRPEQLPTEGIYGLFSAGKLAMIQTTRGGQYAVQRHMDAAENPFPWKVIVSPRVENYKPWAAGVDTHSGTTSSKHPHETFKLIYALADQRFTELVAKGLGYLGARVDDVDTIKPFADHYLSLQYEVISEQERFRQPDNARGREVESVLKNNLDAVFLGQEDLTPAFMQRLKSETDEVLAKPF